MRTDHSRANAFFSCAVLLALVTAGYVSAAENAADSKDALAEVVREAVKHVEPYLVRIDTIGGYEKVDEELANEGASTGLLLDRDGYIMTSSYNFLHEPSSILVQFHGGQRKVAKKIASDSNRMLTLLKVENLQFPVTNSNGEERFATLAKKDVRIGQWSLAVGRALSNEEPNLSLGIISGKDRIWGKALQCDAKVGPNNYGGPLIDVQGRVMGLLVPLSMTDSAVTAGAETYDGGVGLAIPADEMLEVFAKLKEGKDLKPGYLGFTFNETTMFTSEARIVDVLKRTPAEQAGLKRGDRIVKIDGQEIRSVLQANIHLRRHYAGDEITVTVTRKKDPEKGDEPDNLTQHDCRCRFLTREELTELVRAKK